MSAFSFGSRTMCADCEKQTAPYREWNERRVRRDRRDPAYTVAYTACRAAHELAVELGLRGLVRDRHILRAVVAPGDPVQLAEALIRILADPRRAHRMGSEGRKRAKLYSWDEVARRTQRCYEGSVT